MSDQQLPYIDSSGSIVIPFNSDPQYHFWKGGQDLSATLQEIKVTEDLWKGYINKPYPGKDDRS